MFKKLRFTFLTIITFGLLFFIGSLTVMGFDLDIHTLTIKSIEVTADGQFNELEDAALVDQLESFYGDTNLLLTDDSVEYEFSYFEEKGIFQSANPEYQFRVTEDHQFTAYFRATGMAHVVILDSNNKVLGHKILAEGSIISETDLESFKKDLSIKPGYTFTKWSYDFTQAINQGVTFIKAIYDGEETLFDVTVDTETINVEQVLYGKTITVEAPETKDELFFSHWTINGTIASYKRIFTFSVYEDCTVKAIYSETQPDINTFSYLSKNVIDFENKKIFIAQSYTNQKILERGMIFLESDDEVTDIDFGSVGVTRVRALRVTNNGEFAITNTFDKTKHLYVKSYIVLEVGESEYQTIFSDILKVEKEISYNYATDLFFSEYIEGSGSNKALEIFNGTGNDVDLSTYAIYLYSNGAATASNKEFLTGILRHGETYVLCNSLSIQELKDLSNTLSPVANFNGDDALELINNGVVVDSIGQVGVKKSWSENGVATTDMTLVRKSGIFSGRSNSTEVFDPSIEWDAYPIDTFTYLGNHKMDNMAPIIGLDEYKQTAKMHLDNYVSLDNYSLAVSQAVLDEVNNSKYLIGSANTFSDIDKALNNAKQKIDLLPTKLVEYNETKSNLVLPTGDIYSDVNLGSSSKKYITYLWRFNPKGIIDSQTGSYIAPEVDTVIYIEVDILIDGVKFGETLTSSVTAKAPLTNEKIYNDSILYIEQLMSQLNLQNIKTDISLPTSYDLYSNVAFEWLSDKPEVISNEGVFTVPNEDTLVVLTVYINIDGNQYSEQADLTFELLARANTDVEEILKYHFEFNEGDNSYNDTTTEQVNKVNGSLFSVSSHRASYQSSSVSGATKAMIISPRKYDNDGNAWAEFDFGIEMVTKMEFDCYFWNNKAEQYFTKFELQAKVDGEWVVVKDLLLDIKGTLTINSMSIEDISGTHFRFYAEGGKSKGNDARVLIDNLKVYISNLTDTTPPVITPNNTMTEIPLGSSWENLGCSASDDVDGYVACRVVLDEVNPDKVGIYKIIFEAIDSSNNIATLEIYITVYNPSMGDNPYPSLTYDPNNVYVKYIDLGKYGDNDLGESAYIKIGDIDILVDSGMGYSYTMQSIYEVLDAGITGELDYIIATHPHADHIGGFPKIFEKYDVKMAIEFSSPYSTNVVANYITARENEPNLNYCKITENVRGSSKDYCVDTYYLAPSISMEFIDTNFYESSDPNSSSIVFVLNVFGTRILFNGDAEKSQEAVYAPKVGKVDIFKLGHHGSKNATEFVLLTNINPEVAIITNGNYLGNSNGHPTPEAINRIYNFNSSINIYATTGGNGTALDKFIDRNGTLTLSVNSNGYSISAEYSPLKELSQTTFWINHPLRQYAHS